MKKLLITILPLVVLLALPTMTRAQTETANSQSTLFIAENLLKTVPVAGDTLKWTLRSIHDYKNLFNHGFDISGLATYYGDAVFKGLTTFKDLKVGGSTQLGSDGADAIKVEGKISRDGGLVYINDDVRVTGSLQLDNASIGTNEFENGAVGPEDLARSYQVTYATILPVLAGSDALQNGGQLTAILAGITDNSADKPYLIKLEPGIFDLGTGTLSLKPYVDIEGAGQGITTIQSANNGSGFGVVRGAANAELRYLTVLNDLGNVGVVTDSGENVHLTHVGITVKNGTGTIIGMRCMSASPVLNDVDIEVLGDSAGTATGLQFEACSPELNHLSVWAGNAGTANYGLNTNATLSINDSEIVGDGGPNTIAVYSTGGTLSILNSLVTQSNTTNLGYGIYATSGEIHIDRSTITGDDEAISSTPNVYVGNSQLKGGTGGSGTYHCASVYDDTFTGLDTFCDPIII